MCKFKELKKYLEKLEPGEIKKTNELEEMLANCWHELIGGEEAGMLGYKLHSRMEKVEWRSPILSFTIERHGATVLGSSRASLQSWKVDVEKGTAEYTEGRYRQVGPRNAPLYTEPLANEIVKKILAGEIDPRFKWIDNGKRVKVNLKKSVGGSKISSNRTIDGRCRRLRESLIDKMTDEGWKRIGRGAFFERISFKPGEKVHISIKDNSLVVEKEK